MASSFFLVYFYSAIQSPSFASNAVGSKNDSSSSSSSSSAAAAAAAVSASDARSSAEKRELFPTTKEVVHNLHNRTSTMYTLSALQEANRKAVSREAARLGIHPDDLPPIGAERIDPSVYDIHTMDAHDEEGVVVGDELGDNWNEKFLQAHELPIAKHSDAMVKGKRLYDLNRKMVRCCCFFFFPIFFPPTYVLTYVLDVI